jgi:transposase
MSMRPRSGWQVPSLTVQVARAAFPRGTLAMTVRDELGEVFADGQFSSAFGVRGAPAASPGVLALVTALQFAENLTDRQAAQMVARAIDWKYALGLALTDPGFDHSVLSRFRDRLLEHGLERQLFDTLLAALVDKGLLGAGGKQRTDATHVIAVVRELNRLELAGESVRACLEALAVAAPGWLTQVIDIAEWTRRYGARIDAWRLPSSKTKRDALAVTYGQDGLALLRAVYHPAAPAWLAELPAVDALRIVLLQNYVIIVDAQGREVVRRREKHDEGLPPGRTRLTSPYDLDARWAAKGSDLFWNGYKVHLTETADAAGTGAAAPNLITNVETTDASVPDLNVTARIHHRLTDRGLPPDRHYVDAGYPTAELLITSKTDHGITLVTPLRTDHSRSARAGYGSDTFTIDYATRTATCPHGQTSRSWTPAQQHHRDVIVVRFATGTCRPCPARPDCTTARRSGRQLTIRPHHIHQIQHTARANQRTETFTTDYATRAGVEGTISQAVTHGIRHTRYRGLPKTRLQHLNTATAINLHRYHAWHTGTPLDRGHTSNLTRLNHTLTA